MKNICDYTIIQRDADGFGRGTFCAEAKLSDEALVVARVLYEDNNMTAVPWQECEKTENGWKIDLEIPQGGLYRLEARETQGKFDPVNNSYEWAALIGCAYHVGVGEIFALAGQSNMSGYGRDFAYDPPQLGVHVFNKKGEWALAVHPLASVPDPIYRNNDPASGTSPGLSFGRMMSKRLGVPVGLVAAPLGGSSLERWNPAEEDCFLFDDLASMVDEVGRISAVIWYQGCNETNEEEAYNYLEKFTEAVGLWREKFGNIPVVTCQINRHSYKGDGNDRYWGLVRESQRQAALTIPDVYVVPTLDMYTTDGIHNGSGACVIIGERLAVTLLHAKYGQPGFFAPNIDKIKQTGKNEIFLTFAGNHVLKSMDDIASGMNIEDEKGMMKCIKACACSGGVKVTGEREIEGEAVFHAYWEREQAAFFIREADGMPMLACYGVKIEK